MASPSRNPEHHGRPRAERLAQPAARAAMAAVLGVLLLLGAFLPRSAAQSPKPSQYDVQAVYLFDFAKFVRWPPASSTGTLDICIAGQKIYADTLTKIVAGEQIDGRPLAIRMVDRPAQEAGCGILFIGASLKDQLDGFVAAAAGQPVLTVSDVPDFISRGGMIQFVLTGNRVRFAVNLTPVDRSGLLLSSELLKVAVAVKGTPGGGGAP